MANTNKDMNNARSNKKDEFYTMYEDIDKEMIYYIHQFDNKIIYLNCDNPNKSNFYKYFKDKFSSFKLKLLYSTYLNREGNGKLRIYDGINEIETDLKECGGFETKECIDILDKSDIIITNPPFSRFREYFKLLMEHNKSFLILGNMNAITCKDIFPYIKDKKMWFGESIHSGDREFKVPKEYPLEAVGIRIDEEGNQYIRVKGVRWFTNISSSAKKELQVLTKNYSEEYKKYDQYNAVNINKIAEIPYDYEGVMGVPITIVDKILPDGLAHFKDINNNEIKYKIINIDCRVEDNPHIGKRFSINGKETYARILIQKC